MYLNKAIKISSLSSYFSLYKLKKESNGFSVALFLFVCHKARNTIDENIFRLCGVQTLSTLVEMGDS